MQYILFGLGIILSVFAVGISKKYDLFQKYNKYVIAAVVSVLIALSLEVFTFNFISYERNDGQRLQVNFDTATKKGSFEEDGEESRKSSNKLKLNVTKEDETLTYSAEITINSQLKDLDISVDTEQRTTDFEVYYTDEAFQSEYKRVDIEDLTLIKGLPSSGHMKPHFAGKTGKIKLVFTSSADSPISKIKVKLNDSVDFHFNIGRFALVFMIGILAFIFYFTKNTIMIKKWVFITIMVLQMAFMVFLSMATNAVFDDNGKYQGENYEEEMDPYQELTLALTQGKIDLNGVNTSSIQKEQQGIEELQQLDNPYEWGQRDDIDYKWDRVFYNGKYYCYFGIVPVLLVYLPVYLITGSMVNTKILVLLLVMLSAVLMAKLVLTIAKKWKRPLNMWVVLGTIVSFVNASMVMYCINGSKFYEIATMSALVCALAGVDLILNAFVDNGIKKKFLVAGATCMALAVGCRPNYVLVSFLIVPIVLNGLSKNGNSEKIVKNRLFNYIRRIFCKNNAKAIIMFLAPYVIIGVGLMYYNYIRFGSVTEFGAKYQLTVYDTRYYHLSDWGKIPAALARGIFMLPTISSVFPYINPVSESTNYAGFLYGFVYLGILASPVMWLLFMVPWAIKRNVKQMGHKGFVIVSVIVGFVMCYATTTMGGTSLRYSVDFAWIFFIPVIYVIFTIYTKARERKLEKYAVAGLGMLMITTILVNALVCISPSWSTISENVPEIFYRLEEMVVFWK